ncbi:hypothetical protein [uncultured Umboniibacter sp.]|uniref:hypothetical protein n=1 Tax=uncultured Umboniibacter sp. TaxID=1798917 RepID=UPI00262C634E|nr:hypothetical protein [uncultured Umboniibacter sp.]
MIKKVTPTFTQINTALILVAVIATIGLLAYSLEALLASFASELVMAMFYLTVGVVSGVLGASVHLVRLSSKTIHQRLYTPLDLLAVILLLPRTLLDHLRHK